MVFIDYRRSAKIDCGDVCYVGSFRYKGKTGDVLSVPERQILCKNGDRKNVLVAEILSQIGVTYKLSERMTLNDTQEAVRLASMEDQDDDDNVHSVDSDGD